MAFGYQVRNDNVGGAAGVIEYRCIVICMFYSYIFAVYYSNIIRFGNAT